VDDARTAPTRPSSHTAPLVTQLLTASSTLPTPNPTAEPTADPTAPDTPPATEQAAPRAPAAGVHTAPGTDTAGSDSTDSVACGSASIGRRGTAGTQCTPCPVEKKKLTMAGPAPISRAAKPETSTAFRPLYDCW